MAASGAGLGVGTAQAQQTGDVEYRVNAVGGEVSAVDGGPDWGDDEQYLVAGGNDTASHGQPSDIDSSVPDSTPDGIWDDERWDPAEGDEMQYEFDVPDGQAVEVRLYFYDGYDGTSDPGDRVFDVSVEDQTVEDFDPIEEYGDDTGGMESFTVTSDGTIDVDFDHVTENPQINAIEIVSTEPQPNELGGPGEIDFGSVLSGESETETATVTNLGDDGDSSIDISDVSVTGDDAGEFSAGSASQTTLEPGESADVPVTFSPSDVAAKSATLEVSHSGSNSPVTVDLSGEGTSSVEPGFSKSKLQGFSAGNPTAIDFGPDGRTYVSTQGGMVYALDVERTGENSYEVVNEVAIDAIQDIPNHDDFGNLDSSEDNRQITGLTVGGTADQPVVYVGSSDPEIDVGQDDDDTDTNSGAISRLTVDSGSDETLQASDVDHDVLVLGLPRSEENHATNGLDLSADGDTMYVAQGGHTNKGAPGDNFGHTPEYALSAAVLEIDLAQIENDHQAKDLQDYDGDYPSLDFYYGIPTIQNDDDTDGDDLPFGGNDGINQAKLIEDGPVQIYSPGYRNPYDLVLAESGQLYVSDHGPNGGWGGQPADANGDIVADAESVTNHPNEDGSFSTNDQLIAADEGEYGGHAAPIRANPTQADIYDADGNVKFDVNESNSPVPQSMVNPVEADYIPPTSGSPDPGAPAGSANTMEYEDGDKVLFAPTGGTTEYTASNFGGAMEGDILQVELGGDIERVELSADGQTATNSETIFNTGGPLGIATQDDDETFAGTVWTANHGGNDVTVFEPDDYDGTDNGDQCTGADDPSLDEDGDGYDNADEIDAGTDPCSSSSTPPDFDDDGESNLNDPDDDNDGLNDTEDPFAVDPDNGVNTTAPVEYDLSELSLFGENGQGWTGVMTNGQDDYQDLYDPTKMTVGGAAEVLTVEEVPQGDAYQTPNDQQYGFQFGVNTPDEPFTVETTVASFPENPEDFQSAGLQIGDGTQSNYVKLVAAANGGDGGVEFAKEVDDSFDGQMTDETAVAGGTTTLRMTVDPTTDPAPDNGVDEVNVTAEYEVDGTTTEVGSVAMPASWLDTSDGVAPAVGVISTSNGASPFSATWTDISVDYVTPPDNQPPTADAGDDQTVDEGDSVTLDASGSDDPDGDQLGYTWTQTAGPDAGLSQSDGETTTFTAPEVDADETLTFEVNVSDGEDSDADTVNVTVQDTDVAAGEVLHRVNAGGSSLDALDDGPDWSTDTASEPSSYLVDPNGSGTYDDGDDVTPTDDVPDSTPDAVFDAERFDQPDDGVPMDWEFPVESGTEVEVRLYFGNQFDETSESGLREFNASIEDEQVLTNYDPVADVGHANGTMKSFTATVDDDGTLDVDFEHGDVQNPMINAIEVVAIEEDGDPDEEMTVAEAVASYDESGNDSQIEFTEIQQAINWWQTDAEIPGTGGQTIDFQQVQQLINLWQTDATVGDGNEEPTASFTYSPDSPEAGQQVSFDASGSSDDGTIESYEWDFDGDGETDATGEQVTNTFDAAGDYDVELTVTDDDGVNDSATETVSVNESTADPGSASVSVTPDSGTEASTYSSGSFTVENTGDQEISSITFDLSSGAMPDMVWDPDGTAGDQAAKGLVIDSESGDGVGVVSTADDDVFSQPHNGVNGSDGYDVLTVEFTDFEPGESMSFSADNDPTSIKNATISSQEAGPVSGLELARSTVSAEYDDGSVQETQLFGDGSAGGAQATLGESVASAPSIGVQDVDLDDSALRDHHSAATVNGTEQTVTVTGEPDETVTLLHAEGELELDNVPEYDGTPGYDIEAYEANKVENVDYQTVTLDSNGEAEVPVTLLNTTEVGGYNYLVATHGEPGSDTGLDSNVVVLKYEEDAGDDEPADGATSFAVNAGGSEYTAVDGTEFQADADFDGGTTFTTGEAGTPSDPEISNTDDDELYYTERYGNFSYDTPLEDGDYEVTLHFAEIYQGVANDGGEGDRLFDVSIEGQQVLDSYDIYAEAGGPHAAIQETFTAEVTDGELNVEFTTVEDNAKVSAIEVEPIDDGGDDNTAPTVDTIDDLTVTEGDSTTVQVNASDSDGDTASLSADGPDFVGLTDNGDGTGTLDVAPQDGDAGTYTVNVTADDGTTTTTESFQLTVESSSTGDEPVYAVNAGGSEYTAADGTNYVNDTEFAGEFGGSEGTTDISQDIGNTQDDPLYQTERYGDPLSYSVPVEDGTYEVTLQFAEIYHGVDGGNADGGEGDRVFNASVEGEQVLSDYDIYADVGALNATEKTFTVEVTDGELDIELDASEDFGKLSAFTVSEADSSDDGGDDNTAPTIEAIDDQTVTEGDSTTVPVNASDPDGDTVSLSVSGPDFVTLDDSDLTVAPESGDAGTYTVNVTADDGTDQTTESFEVTVEESEPQTLHRVNAGESETLNATDNGPDWTGVEDADSEYLVSADAADNNYCGGEITSTTANVPSSTPDGVWDCERYGNSTWEFDVDSGQQVEVRLYVGNSYSEASEPGDRQFNVSIEDDQVLTQYDPVDDVGHETGTMKSFTVTDDGDGTVTVAFEQGAAENPEVRAIEIVETEENTE
ncbi:malectin domain-containing carbohydrate-binding protein [Halorubrum sp. 48-1-W]|uniref:malectin domain-containing carbohydrate-binding protein n=1 Tax=Halorubrum sp. 48-1-W TaxID=2249761 RepID=UPI0018E5A288|nr:malectin domain-containing carbohydrate-binding protein [Halorubrum sp. 48-1-W]